jgi:hypothetical protein
MLDQVAPCGDRRLTLRRRALRNQHVATSMSDASAIPIFHVVGFSGHRQLSDSAAAAEAITKALETLRQEVPGEWIGLSSIATGSDQVFASVLQNLRLSWHAILPLPRADFQRDFPPVEWVRVEQMLTRAEHVRVVDAQGSREDAYLDCGMETVDGSDVLVALWDGLPAHGRGGTADVIEYARSTGKPLLILDAQTLTLRRENWHRFVQSDSSLNTLNALPTVQDSHGANPFKAPDNVYRFQQKCDAAASHGAPQFRRLIVSTVMLHVIATLIAATTLAYEIHNQALPWAKLLCLAGALGVALVLRRHSHSHHSWVRCRLAAEFCRSALATWGLPRAAPLFEDLDLPAVRGLGRSLHILHSRSFVAQPITMGEFKEIYLIQRIGDQLEYYHRQEMRALPLFTRLKAGFWIATILALACTLAYAVARTLHVDVAEWIQTTVFYFLPISLPVVAAAFISFISINDLQRRVARFREMQIMLEESRRKVSFCQTWNSLERIVQKTEYALMQEVLEWHSITSFSESH